MIRLRAHLASRRDRVGVLVSGVIVATGSVALAASGIFSGPREGTADRPKVASAVTGESTETGLTRWASGERRKAPVLSGQTLTGSALSTARFRGSIVVLNAWGSWCAPCREEAPDLRRAAEDISAQGVQFIGIDTRDNDAAARAFVREFRIPYPSLVDDKGELLLRLRSTVPPQAIPSTILLDGRGRVAARVVGRITYSTLRGLLDDLIAERR